ncbi:MAG: protein of unknown function DUF2547 [Siphoviridae sp. ctCJE6]|nr:MAG: protein of unknown function DUF2547 [Siphoviridae sp. ctCJE6]
MLFWERLAYLILAIFAICIVYSMFCDLFGKD